MPIKIVVTGPESTGKTTLCTRLSEFYKGTMIPEFSRAYLHKTGGKYELKDVETIGLTQEFQNKNLELEGQFVFCDTDSLTAYIWAKEKFKFDSQILRNEWQKNLPDLYLLCYPDLKWEYDDLRESEDDLERLFGLYYSHIIQFRAKYAIISGVGRVRMNNALFMISQSFYK